MWVSALFGIIALFLLIVPITRRNEGVLAVACASVIISTWIDKGLGLIIGGFTPNPFERVTDYWPTAPEVVITLGLWALGSFIVLVLYKIAVSVKEEVAA